ncbi:hypothetical protein [Nocardia ninae]|uniref:Lipoprotein LppI n=1 Tax=Nocardia ninae NBRC 108245 TaxID=1210091 RepID=A0A511MSS2_9NOCA|nr:hypothetical protein [Nocardia ninae]GEM43619.1 hypothetical protein NN4_81380 [Nocardia ninae NBRC 108245]
MQIRGARIAVVPCAVALALLAGCGNDDKDSGTPTSSSVVPSSPAASSSAAPTTTATAAPTSSTPRPHASGPVDPAQYRQQMGYYFQSPSGSFLCAILDQPIDDNAQVGCQGPTTPAPAEFKECWSKNPQGSTLTVGKRSGARCLNQGVFVGAPIDGGSRGGGRVLPYGGVLTVGAFTCDSAENGVTCTNDTTGAGFTIARESNRTF